MRQRSRYLCLLLAVSCLLVAARVALAASDAETQIRQARTAMNKAFADHDIAAMESYMTDRVAFSGPAWRLVGHDQVTQAHEQYWKGRPDATWDYLPEEIIQGNTPQSDKWVSESGHWLQKWTAADGPTELRGTYLAFWQFNNGKWMLDAHLFVTTSCKGGAFCAGPVRRPDTGGNAQH